MPAEALPARRARLSLPKPPAPNSPGSSPGGGRANWGPSDGVCIYSPFRKKQLKSHFLDKLKKKKKEKQPKHITTGRAQIYSRGGCSHRPWAGSARGWEPTSGAVAEMAGLVPLPPRLDLAPGYFTKTFLPPTLNTELCNINFSRN